MNYIADLHIHSRFSLATSRELRPTMLHHWARRKGIMVVGTGDFTHPTWFGELQSELEPAEDGLFKLLPLLKAEADAGVPEKCDKDVRFILSSEINNIYKRGGKTRKVHNLVYSRDFKTAARINKALVKIGKLTSDGRPILKMDSEDLLKIVVDQGPNAFLIPAHIWTPHFSVLGTFSNFSSLEECYGDLASHIFAIETGLSSDPPMNWRLSSLDRVALVSNSDAHSPEKLGREANLFDAELSWPGMVDALKARDGKGFRGTIEFFPEEGKYHYDGHRKCGVCLAPEFSQQQGDLCPGCGKKMTLGVCNRIAKLADRPADFKPDGALPFESVIALKTILSECLGVGPNTKKVRTAYDKLQEMFGSEFHILRDLDPDALDAADIPRLSEAITRMRDGDIVISPGYDGEFGTVKIFPHN